MIAALALSLLAAQAPLERGFTRADTPRLITLDTDAVYAVLGERLFVAWSATDGRELWRDTLPCEPVAIDGAHILCPRALYVVEDERVRAPHAPFFMSAERLASDGKTSAVSFENGDVRIDSGGREPVYVRANAAGAHGIDLRGRSLHILDAKGSVRVVPIDAGVSAPEREPFSAVLDSALGARRVSLIKDDELFAFRIGGDSVLGALHGLTPAQASFARCVVAPSLDAVFDCDKTRLVVADGMGVRVYRAASAIVPPTPGEDEPLTLDRQDYVALGMAGGAVAALIATPFLSNAMRPDLGLGANFAFTALALAATTSLGVGVYALVYGAIAISAALKGPPKSSGNNPFAACADALAMIIWAVFLPIIVGVGAALFVTGAALTAGGVVLYGTLTAIDPAVPDFVPITTLTLGAGVLASGATYGALRFAEVPGEDDDVGAEVARMVTAIAVGTVASTLTHVAIRPR